MPFVSLVAASIYDVYCTSNIYALGLGNMPFLVLFGLSDDDGSLRAFALNCAARVGRLGEIGPMSR